MKKLAILSLLLTSFFASAQSLELPAPPKSGKYEDASTRGVELCMNLNYVLAHELEAAIREKHKKNPFISVDELLIITEFEPYREYMLNSALLGSFLTMAGSDLIDGFIPDEDTLQKVNNYYLTPPALEVKKDLDTCNKYVEIIGEKVDPEKGIRLSIAGQKKLLSENLFKELQIIKKD